MVSNNHQENTEMEKNARPGRQPQPGSEPTNSDESGYSFEYITFKVNIQSPDPLQKGEN